ncbi:cell division protein FtsL [Marinicrinis lubricantis]|uniref:Cell division protein FtsL n=1 Tax=Marinicrinis lubricantis TaxID=2086470 RepID=A0ABW1IS93_9BACL
MSAYYNGNLALDPKKKPKVKVRETRKVVSKKVSIPMAEKLLYLLVIILCMAVAAAVIWRYAQIYSLNTKIQEVERKIDQLESSNATLQLKAQELLEPSRLMKQAEELGLVYVNENSLQQVQSGVSAQVGNMANNN